MKQMTGWWKLYAICFIVASAIATFYATALYAGWIAACLAAPFGGAIGGIIWGTIHRQGDPLPEPKFVAANEYWEAFASKHNNLGIPSLEAEEAARNFKRRRPARAYRASYGTDSDFLFDMPQMRPGLTSAAYWIAFDQARLEASMTKATRANAEQAPRNSAGPNKSADIKAAQSEVRLPLHLALIEDAQSAQIRIRNLSKSERNAFAQVLTRISDMLDAIITDLKSEPKNLFQVQRLFTYYLPQVMGLLNARAKMEKIRDQARVTEIDTILARIETAFEQFAARMHQADIRDLAIDLKLLDQSLAAEFESTIVT